MKIQYQTKLDEPEKGIIGNCMMTTYACYFDCDVADVPNIEDLFNANPEGFWYRALEMWLAEYKYKKKIRHSKDPWLMIGYQDYYFAVGPSHRGVIHQVIYKRGILFHDPHPSGDGILEEDHYITLEDNFY
jgi:hypothetical protein